MREENTIVGRHAGRQRLRVSSKVGGSERFWFTNSDLGNGEQKKHSKMEDT